MASPAPRRLAARGLRLVCLAVAFVAVVLTTYACRSATEVTVRITTEVPCSQLQGVSIAVGTDPERMLNPDSFSSLSLDPSSLLGASQFNAYGLRIHGGAGLGGEEPARHRGQRSPRLLDGERHDGRRRSGAERPDDRRRAARDRARSASPLPRVDRRRPRVLDEPGRGRHGAVGAPPLPRAEVAARRAESASRAPRAGSA